MDDDWVIAFDVEHADLEQCSVGRWADEHGQVIIQDHSSHGVANGVPYVSVENAVLSRWLTDPHPDNIACLVDGSSVTDGGPLLAHAPQFVDGMATADVELAAGETVSLTEVRAALETDEPPSRKDPCAPPDVGGRHRAR
jgi:hypothetical protein